MPCYASDYSITLTVFLSLHFPPRPHGECSSPLQRTPKADSTPAHWPTLSCPPFSSPCCLPSNASTDPVPRPASTAYSHDALPRQAEPHYPHPETLWPRPSRDTAGEGVQVIQGLHSLFLEYKLTKVNFSFCSEG